MSHPAAYKPSPLSFGSPRCSPFRRPEPPSSPSSTIRPSTPTNTSTKPQTPSRLKEASTPEPIKSDWTPSSQGLSFITPREPPASPAWNSRANEDDNIGSGRVLSISSIGESVNGSDSTLRHTDVPRLSILGDNPVSRLPPAQVREMREAFQILDRDSDGQVTKDDVVDTLHSLGLDTSALSLHPYFPPSRPSNISLPSYLSNLSSLLAPFSPTSELLAAFAAFDDDNSGQIDVSELRDALLHTSPEVGEQVLQSKDVDAAIAGWVGRRAFGKGLTGGAIQGKSEVFRYQNWVGNLGSVGNTADETSESK